MHAFLSICREPERDAAMRKFADENRQRGGNRQNQIRWWPLDPSECRKSRVVETRCSFCKRGMTMQRKHTSLSVVMMIGILAGDRLCTQSECGWAA